MRLGILYALGFLALLIGALYLFIKASNREYQLKKDRPHSMNRGMRGIAGTSLATSSIFLLVVAMLLNSWPLFYMTTAVIATLLASRFQAYLAVRGLRFERLAPEEVSVGEDVLIEIVAWSEKNIRRPLILVDDILPSRMAATDRTSALPIAPAFDVPIRTRYRFRPNRRGRFTWKDLDIHGTDALGLVTTTKRYETEPSTMLVVPTPIPLDLDVPAATGFGIAETEAGMGRGAGIEPRGIREYAFGDSIRYIHWPSSARSGQLMVKEFETGANATVVFVLPRNVGSDIGKPPHTTLELMCSHIAYLTERMLRTGAQVLMPVYEDHRKASGSPHERYKEVLVTLAGIEGETSHSLSSDLITSRDEAPAGSLIYVFVSQAEENLPLTIRDTVARGYRVNALLYDPAAFVKSRLAVPRDGSPMEAGYREALRQAGAFVVEVPCAAK